MRTVFLGSSLFAVDVLGALAATPHKPALVVAPPNRPQGRGRKTAPPPTAVAARDLGIALLQAERVNDPEPVAAIADAAPDAVGVCEFGQLIREPLLSQYLMLNVHPSLLPRWRGAAPIERALMAGDTVTGVTIFRLEEGFDSGPIALSRAEPIHPDDDRGTLGARLAALGATLLIEAFDSAEAGTLELEPQPEDGVTYADKIDPAERRLDPARSALELERVVRALTPGIVAYVELDGGERLGVEAARAADAALKAGQVAADDSRLLVGCAEGALELLRVRPAGGRSMAAADYLRGHRPASRLAD
jgi:methionyl-tRNA formyltransferase